MLVALYVQYITWGVQLDQCSILDVDLTVDFLHFPVEN